MKAFSILVVRRLRFLLAGWLVLSSSFASLYAQSTTSAVWTGQGGDTLWSNPANWANNLLPTNDSNASVNFSAVDNRVVTLDQDWDVRLVTFASAAGGYEIESVNDASLGIRIGVTALNPSEQHTINVDIRVLDILNNTPWRVNTTDTQAPAKPILFNGDIDNNGRDIYMVGRPSDQFHGVISGSGGIITDWFQFAGFYGPNTFTGEVRIERGGLTLAGDEGGFLGTEKIVVTDSNTGSVGVLAVGDFDATVANPKRLNDQATLVLANGNIVFRGSNNPAITREEVSTLKIAPGLNRFSAMLADNNLHQAEMFFETAPVREAGGFLRVSGRNLGQSGSGTTRLLFGETPELRGGSGGINETDIAISPFIFNDDTGFTTYGENGIRPLALTELREDFAGDPLDNVRISNSHTLAESTTVNALHLVANASTSLDMGGNTLELGSGVLLLGRDTVMGGGTIDFGDSMGVIRLTGGPTQVLDLNATLAGTEGLQITSDSMHNTTIRNHIVLQGSNTYTGDTHLGTVTTISNANALGLNGGTVFLHQGGSLLLDGSIHLDKNVISTQLPISLNPDFGNGRYSIGAGNGDSIITGGIDFRRSESGSVSRTIAVGDHATLTIQGSITTEDERDLLFIVGEDAFLNLEGEVPENGKIGTFTKNGAGELLVLSDSVTENLSLSGGILTIANTAFLVDSQVTLGGLGFDINPSHLIVEGPQGLLAAGENLTVPSSGMEGRLTIRSGSRVELGENFDGHSASIGNATSTTILLTGNNSAFTTSGRVSIGSGNNGIGTFTVAEGGSAQFGNSIQIAVSNTSTGRLVVEGADSTVNAAGAIYVGGVEDENFTGSGARGSGILEVRDGGTLNANGITIWSTGRLEGSGGTIESSVENYGVIALDGPLKVMNISSLSLHSDSRLILRTGADSDRISLQGLSLWGSAYIDILAEEGATEGIYTLIDYSNYFANSYNVYLGTLPDGWSAHLVHNTDDQTIDLHVTSIGESSIDFPDSSLEAALRLALDKPDGGITPSVMAALTELDLSGLGIADISGLEHASNLENLDLRNNDLVSVQQLSELASLQWLDINGNPLDFTDPDLRDFLYDLADNGVGIEPVAQTITFTLDTGVSYSGGDEIPLVGTASSTLPVSFTLSDASMGTISGSLLTLTESTAGPLTITASQPGDDLFAAAPEIHRTITVISSGQHTYVTYDVLVDGTDFFVHPPVFVVSHPVNNPTLTLINGATASFEGATVIGNLNGESGNLVLLNGGMLSNTGNDSLLDFFHHEIVYGGNGYIGLNSGSIGSALISGEGSAWINSGSVHIGRSGAGELTILNGGSVSNTYGEIGGSESGNGKVTVAGNDSIWTNSNALYISGAGVAELLISDGGSVFNTSGYIGSSGNTWGSVTVNGEDSSWTSVGQLYVGEHGTGIMTIENGGNVQSLSGYIGWGNGSNGTVTVTGQGSIWTTTIDSNPGDLVLGGLSVIAESTAEGTLYIRDGGKVIVGDSSRIWNGSTMEIEVLSGHTTELGGGHALSVDHNLINEGLIRLTAAASTPAGSFEPVFVGENWTGNGTIQTIGGVWNPGSREFVITSASTGISGATTAIDLNTNQRFQIDDGFGGQLLVAFDADALTADATSTIAFTATELNLSTIAEEQVLSAWNLATDLAPETHVQISLKVRPGSFSETLILWFRSDDSSDWEVVEEGVFRSDDWISLLTAELGEYAVTGEHDGSLNFADAALEAALRTALGIPEEPLTAADLSSLTTLNFSGLGISDLSGLEHAVNLVSLDLSDNDLASLSSLAALSDLNSLTSLDLNDNPLDFADPDLRAFLDTLAGSGVTIEPLSQTITFNLDEESDYIGGQEIELDATASSGLPVALTLSDSAMGTVENNVLTLVPSAHGSLTITASQAGDDLFAVASPVHRTLQITPLPVVITIPDSALEAALREVLEKPEGNLTEQDLATLTSLDFSGLDISDLSGLEYAVNLVALDLSDNDFTDLSGLLAVNDLTSLTSLDLNGNPLDFTDPDLRNFLAGLDGNGVSLEPIPQTITFELDDETAYEAGSSISLSAAADSGLPVALNLSDPTLGEIDGDQLVLAPEVNGILVLTATQPGDFIFAPADEVARSIEVFFNPENTFITADTSWIGTDFDVYPPLLIVSHPTNDPTLLLREEAHVLLDGTVIVGNSDGETGHVYLVLGSTLSAEGSGLIDTFGFEPVQKGRVYIGFEEGAHGSATIDGPDTRLDAEDNIYVGFLGSGNLFILNGGRVSSRQGHISTWPHDGDLLSRVSVAGAGSEWEIQSALFVGSANRGRLDIEAGGRVISHSGVIGGMDNGSGTVEVVGAGSVWDLSGDLSVGIHNSGILRVLSGASVTSQRGFVGGNSNEEDAHVLVSGSNASWEIADNLSVGGGDGDSEVEIRQGGAVTVDGHTSISRNGRLTLNQGTFSTRTLSFHTEGELNFETGHLHVADMLERSLTIPLGGTLSGGAYIAGDVINQGTLRPNIGNMHIEGTYTHGYNAKLDIAIGGVFLGAEHDYLSVSGQTTLLGGTLQVTFKDDFVPELGDGFHILFFNGGVEHTFSNLDLPELPDGLIWNIENLYTTGILSVGEQMTTITSDTTISDPAWSVVPPALLVSHSENDPTLTLTNGVSDSWIGAVVVGNLSGETGRLELTQGSQLITTGASTSIPWGDDMLIYQGHGYLGLSAGARGEVLISGTGSRWTLENDIRVGVLGAGEVLLKDGGFLFTKGGYLGLSADAEGTLLIDGQNSRWEYSLEAYVGYGGTGEVVILNGGRVTGGAAYLGESFGGSHGKVTITGEGSSWTNTGLFAVGENGSGELLIEEGGALYNSTGRIGIANGFTGTAIVRDPGSSWTNSNMIEIGVSGEGTLTIANGGSVTSKAANIGRNAGSTGVVIVDGEGSSWSADGNLLVGRRGYGELSILNGALLSSLRGNIGDQEESNGVVTVSGEGSAWNISSDLVLAGTHIDVPTASTGILDISDGGSVIVGSGVRVHQGGSLYLKSGGTLETATLNHSTGSFAFSGGTLLVSGQVTGDLIIPQEGILESGTLLVGSLTNAGILRPSGPLLITSSFLQESGGTTEVQLGESEEPIFTIEGDAQLGGMLKVSFEPGYVPTNGTSFQLFVVEGTLSGQFALYDFPELPGDLFWNTDQLYSEGVLWIGLPYDPEVEFTDTALEAFFRDLLSVPSDPITASMLQSIESLDLSNQNITDIAGLEFVTGLMSLDLHDNQLTDLSPLLALTELEELNLNGNPLDFSDPEILTQLNQLKQNGVQLASFDQFITFGLDSGTPRVSGTTVFLPGSASSGLPLTFTLSDPEFGTLLGNRLFLNSTAVGELTITASQEGNDLFASAQPISRTITVVPPKPVITSPSNAAGQQNEAFVYQITATQSPYSFGASGLPEGLSVDSSTGQISGVPQGHGSFPITLTATNDGGSGTLTLSLTIAPPVPPPTILGPSFAAATVGDSFTLQITASNQANDYELLDPPDWLSVSSSGVLEGIPPIPETLELQIRASNPTGPGVWESIQLQVEPNPLAPSLPGSSELRGRRTVPFHHALQAEPSASGFAVVSGSLPPGLSLNSSTGVISGTPLTTGTFQPSIQASNEHGPGRSAVYRFVIDPAPQVPVITSSATMSATLGASFSTTLLGTFNPTAFTFEGLPSWLTQEGQTGQISGTPLTPGSYTFSVYATNVDGDGPVQNIIIDVQPSPLAPVISIQEDLFAYQGLSFSLEIPTSPSATTLTATNLPPGVEINPDTLYLEGTPMASGIWSIVLQATNNDGPGAERTVLFEVAPTPDTPRIVGSLEEFAYGQTAFSYQTQTDSELPILGFAATGLPSGLSIHPATGVISGSPLQLGTFDIRLSASNAVGTGGERILRLTILPGQTLPRITSSAFLSVGQGEAVNYQITASNGPITSYEALHLPIGLTLNSLTGAITGSLSVPGTHDIILRAANINGSGPSQTLRVVASPVESAPIVVAPSRILNYPSSIMNWEVPVLGMPESPWPAGAGLYAEGLPPGFQINNSTGVISGQAQSGSGPGVWPVSLYAISPEGLRSKTVTVEFELAKSRTMPVETFSVSNSNRISIPDSGKATPYPSAINVAGRSGVITNVTVALKGFSHTWPSDLDILLVGPNGDRVGLFGRRGGSANVNNLTITFNDEAMSSLGSSLTSGHFKPSGVSTNLPTPAPSQPYSSQLGTFRGISPNGTWSLYIVDRASRDSGAVSGGWQLNITTQPSLNDGAGVPIMRSPMQLSGREGENLSFTLQADRYASLWSFSMPGLINLSQGSPTFNIPASSLPRPGQYIYSIGAANSNGWGDVSGLPLRISPAAGAPSISSSEFLFGRVGEPLVASIEASGNPNRFEADFSGSIWPSGVQFHPETGVFSGTPTTPGSYSFLARARNTHGWSLPKFTTLVILPALPEPEPEPMQSFTFGSFSLMSTHDEGDSIDTLSSDNDLIEVSGQVGVLLAHSVSFSDNPNFFTARNLPEGLVLNEFTGEISGLPEDPGVFIAYLRPFRGNVIGEEIEIHFTIQPAEGTPVMSGGVLIEGVAGEEIEEILSATPTAAAFNIEDLPDFLIVDPFTGEISGTPHAPGTFTFTASAINELGQGMPVVVTLVIAPAEGTPVLSVEGALPTARVGDPYTLQLTSSPTTDFYDGRSLPYGLSLDSDTGIISGSPLVPGETELELWGINESGQGATFILPLEIAPGGTPVIEMPEVVRVLANAPIEVEMISAPMASTYSLSPIPEGFHFDPSTGLLTGPAVLGTWTFEVSGSNDFGPGNTASIQLISYQSTSDLWRRENFDEVDPSFAEWTASPLGDGISNLLKYAFNMDPWVPHHRERMPELSVTTDSGETYPTITVMKNPAATDVTLIPEVSTTLAPDSWQSGPVHFEVLHEDDESLTVRSRTPISEHSSQFLRVRVVLDD